MSAEMTFPVRLRVGDSEEHEVGTVTVEVDTEKIADLYGGLAELLRKVADEFDKRSA